MPDQGAGDRPAPAERGGPERDRVVVHPRLTRHYSPFAQSTSNLRTRSPARSPTARLVS